MTTQNVKIKIRSVVDLFNLMAYLEEAGKIYSWELYDTRTTQQTIAAIAEGCRCEEGR